MKQNYIHVLESFKILFLVQLKLRTNEFLIMNLVSTLFYCLTNAKVTNNTKSMFYSGRSARQVWREWGADVGRTERDGDLLLVAAARRDGKHRQGSSVLRRVCQDLQFPHGMLGSIFVHYVLSKPKALQHFNVLFLKETGEKFKYPKEPTNEPS